jgi:general secretion pathway protein A
MAAKEQRVRHEVSRQDRPDLITRSRAALLAGIRDAIERDGAPVLLTGEAGSGKTWLLDHLVATQSARRIWIQVSAASHGAPADLPAAIGRRLGLGNESGRSTSWWASEIETLLEEVQIEGRCVGLIVEELHLANPDVLEEIRRLANRTRQPGGFDAILLSAQTALLPRLEWRSLASLDAVVRRRFHLRPLDADEAERLCSVVLAPLARSTALIEELHREARGNAARLLRLAGTLNTGTERGRGRVHRGDPAHTLWPDASTGATIERGGDELSPRAPLIPTRRPLKEEEGVIEVGWDSEETWSGPGDAPPTDVAPASGPPGKSQPPLHEPIDDRYARLQAEAESSRASLLSEDLVAHILAPDPEDQSGSDSTAAIDDDDTNTSDSQAPGQVWVEPAERFAPYGNLFSPRAPQSRNDP